MLSLYVLFLVHCLYNLIKFVKIDQNSKLSMPVNSIVFPMYPQHLHFAVHPFFIKFHFKFMYFMYVIGRSRGCCQCMPPPPTRSISFIFAYIFAKECMHQRLVPPQWVSTPPPPPQREILHLPLYVLQSALFEREIK